jgi:transmembrane sensor
MDRNSIDWERLDRYATGRATAEELAALEAWVSSDPELRAIAAAMRTAGRPAGVEPRKWDVRGAWQRLRRRMGRAPLRMLSPADREYSPLGSPIEIAARWRARWLVGAAAAVVVLAGASVFALIRHSPAPTMREVSTHRGQTAALNLPDGSRVMLGPASRLRIPADIGAVRVGNPRDIYLEGEAYLEVKHDGTRPFRVHTATGVAEDIGTEFLVTAYPETPGMRVVVASGVVALYQPPPAASTRTRTQREHPQPLLTLAEGDLAELASTGIATLTRDVDVAPYVAWTKGDLGFDATRLGDAVTQLERWYDVDIRLADSSLADRRLTATFRRASLTQVLELLSLSLDVRVQREGRSILLKPKVPRQVSP